MTRRSSNPVVSFGPELMALLIKGSRETVIVPCKDAKDLQYLQMRVHMLRGAMGREKHPQFTTVQRARTSRMWDLGANGKPHNFRLRVEPQDLRFRSAIEAAGVTIDTAHVEDVLADTEITTPLDPSIEHSHEEPSSDPYAAFKPRKD